MRTISSILRSISNWFHSASKELPANTQPAISSESVPVGMWIGLLRKFEDGKYGLVIDPDLLEWEMQQDALYHVFLPEYSCPADPDPNHPKGFPPKIQVLPNLLVIHSSDCAVYMDGEDLWNWPDSGITYDPSLFTKQESVKPDEPLTATLPTIVRVTEPEGMWIALSRESGNEKIQHEDKKYSLVIYPNLFECEMPESAIVHIYLPNRDVLPNPKQEYPPLIHFYLDKLVIVSSNCVVYMDGENLWDWAGSGVTYDPNLLTEWERSEISRKKESQDKK